MLSRLVRNMTLNFLFHKNRKSIINVFNTERDKDGVIDAKDEYSGSSSSISCSKTVPTSVKRRKYDGNYISYGFIDAGGSIPQCVVCGQTFENSTMVPAKMTRHLQSKHAQYADKPVEFFT